MESRVGKWGNSLGIRIPQSLAKQLGLVADETVELTVSGNCLLIRKIQQYNLNDLLAQITEDNIHEEIQWGPPVGNEQW